MHKAPREHCILRAWVGRAAQYQSKQANTGKCEDDRDAVDLQRA